MPYPTDPMVPPAQPQMDWKQMLTAFAPMIAAGFAGQGTGLGAFGENYARGASVADELQMRQQALQQRQAEQAWQEQQAEQERQWREQERTFRILENYPKLREQALDLAEQQGLMQPDLIAQQAAGTIRDYQATLAKAFPGLAKYADRQSVFNKAFGDIAPVTPKVP